MGVTIADLTMLVVVAALTAYALLGGADFGGGFWDMFAGSHTDQRAVARRRLIEHALGPVWEANHVWLIFAIVLLWTGFPEVFAAVASTAYIPLTAAALGIIGRGSAFAFRKISLEPGQQRMYSLLFGFSSIATPFFFGSIAGGIASGRIPLGIAAGELLESWWNPTSIATGVLAVGLCAYLAAMFLTGDADREAPALLAGLRQRAIWASAGFAVLAGVGLLVIRVDAPELATALTRSPAVWFIVAGFTAGLVSLLLLRAGRVQLVRLTAGLTAASVLWAWAAAQYPDALPGTSIEEAAAGPAVLRALIGATLVGGLLLLPSLAWLFIVSQRPPRTRRPDPAAAGRE